MYDKLITYVLKPLRNFFQDHERVLILNFRFRHILIEWLQLRASRQSMVPINILHASDEAS